MNHESVTDMRDVHKEIENGNKKAELALNMLVRSIKIFPYRHY